MKIRFLENECEEIIEIETETDLEGTLYIIDTITDYCINNNIYKRTDTNIRFDVDTNAVEICVRES